MPGTPPRSEDGDPLPLARGLVASLALRAPALLDALSPALDGAHGPDARGHDIVDALAPALSAALHAGLMSDVTLVVDDLHEVPQRERRDATVGRPLSHGASTAAPRSSPPAPTCRSRSPGCGCTDSCRC